MARIMVAFVHDLLKQVNEGQISFSRMVELINEEANKPEIKKCIGFHSDPLSANQWRCLNCGRMESEHK